MPSTNEGETVQIPAPDLAQVAFFVQQPETEILSVCHV
ncbi:hypothetical protein EDC23_0632 [Thiohalophilus thiocyanatoxydans]|uniref:Uncharacterized protein n=1 Tax=Thiohalophilus thiocyanatoxydans TaxID=381308 RepID=A0A4R8J224_9GAMM|nr:hypothetical protein EDC23_0632 [Thiohalophilus thiocyanatoxydans]